METGWTALRLGLTSFGGPIAHIGYFRNEYVHRRRWVDEETFADLTSMCQFLPGPASSQLGMSLGMKRAGVAGALSAWVGFTLPSALLMTFFAFAAASIGKAGEGLLHGLMLAAVAVVAQAVWSMARTSVTDVTRAVFAVCTAAIALWLPGTAGQLPPLVLCGAAGWLLLRKQVNITAPIPDVPRNRPVLAMTCLSLFFILLALLPVLSVVSLSPLVNLADIGYRAGSLVFGGGHVVLPMLEHESVRSGLLTERQFVEGYGAAQAVPGPLFTFAAYIGAVSSQGLQGCIRAAVMLIAIFLPSFLLVAGVMPFWEGLRANKGTRAALAGVNAAVVGLLAAALYDPVWTSAVRQPIDIAVAAAAFVCLVLWRWPSWLIVAASALAGWMIYG
ncbi:chromate efflux transporter [Cohnella pontilimi]|uniref:Chromate efflux transporter n=2 Tax=Cohnella pontilimi TaxID=2564100 RepID=A0A4U0FI16_9BACL|nr:chromate efflux transporter [Cohnella pontilimi]TJY44588.1 chromate efflux transporter [Cohnella pontilimi]